MQTTGINPYPLHSARWILRSIASIFLFLSFPLYIADGVACVNEIKAYNDLYYDYDEVSVAGCWTSAFYGDLRPILCVRTPISIAHG
jgi:hypothetical protein